MYKIRAMSSEQYTYFTIPTAPPVLQTCVVCKRDCISEPLQFPCNCMIHIHANCIDEWKRRGGSCERCGTTWILISPVVQHVVKTRQIRRANWMWFAYCLFILGLGVLLSWLFVHYVWEI